ncbi:alpha-amylase family glycosyl hydrolase [Saccharopolyspora sp. 5N708]|uniref:alpha-amylase family glycosyl hydrolase n=1 Tax=Saccharopolyspora sp. 5N708 TaxID=3457424 RepID=UPI003FD06F97
MRRVDAQTGHGRRPWWWDAVCYQVDVGSFADGNGDGIGDLDGLRTRLGYLELLGVDAIVLAGVAGVDPVAEPFRGLLAEAHEAGIRLMLALDVDPARSDPRAVLVPWLEHGVDGFLLAPRSDPANAIGAALAGYPDRVVIGIGAGDWHLSFNLDLAIAGFQAESVRKAITDVLAAPTSRPAWAMASRDTELSRDDAALTPVRAMALVQLALPGAVCLRHGEELGLPGAQRVRMPWEGDRPPFGFSTAEADWTSIPADWAAFTVEAQLEDEKSTLSLYRHALETRSTHPAFTGDDVEWFGAPAECFAFRRTGSNLVCALNTSAAPVPVPPGEVLLTSRPLESGELQPGSAAWLV